MDAWRRLGIEPTTEVRAIKRAYAGRVKEANPEEDPKGFQELRAAFETALEWARTAALHETEYRPPEEEEEERADLSARAQLAEEFFELMPAGDEVVWGIGLRMGLFDASKVRSWVADEWGRLVLEIDIEGEEERAFATLVEHWCGVPSDEERLHAVVGLVLFGLEAEAITPSQGLYWLEWVGEPDWSEDSDFWALYFALHRLCVLEEPRPHDLPEGRAFLSAFRREHFLGEAESPEEDWDADAEDDADWESRDAYGRQPRDPDVPFLTRRTPPRRAHRERSPPVARRSTTPLRPPARDDNPVSTAIQEMREAYAIEANRAVATLEHWVSRAERNWSRAARRELERQLADWLFELDWDAPEPRCWRLLLAANNHFEWTKKGASFAVADVLADEVVKRKKTIRVKSDMIGRAGAQGRVAELMFMEFDPSALDVALKRLGFWERRDLEKTLTEFLAELEQAQLSPQLLFIDQRTVDYLRLQSEAGTSTSTSIGLAVLIGLVLSMVVLVLIPDRKTSTFRATSSRSGSVASSQTRAPPISEDKLRLLVERCVAAVEQFLETERGNPFIQCTRPARRGDPEAQYRLGLCFRDGLGVASSDMDAAVWFAWAAEKGHTQAQVALEKLYENGRADPAMIRGFVGLDEAN